MPKRVPTPPPGDDEPRYLTVVYPYAISGTCNMELPKDRQDFARWVASCIDKNAFFAIFHKPSARAMVIIEVSRNYEHFDRILGEHRWSEFLLKPAEEEMGRITQVFHCSYSTGRIVQKNGWKRIDVDESWFQAKDWSPRNRHIRTPYPPTHFCDVPFEDQTNHSLCRPLPGAVKMPKSVIAAPQPVVGSPAWIHSKGGGHPPAPAPTQTKTNTLGAWGKGTPKLQTAFARPDPTANGSAKQTIGIPQGPSPGMRLAAEGGGSIAVKAGNVWQNTSKKCTVTPVVGSWDDSAPVSRQDTPVLPAVPPSTAQAPGVPSGLPARKSAWDDAAPSRSTHPPGLVPSKISTVVAQGAPDRTTNFSAASWDSPGVSTPSPDSDSGPDLTTATESDNPYSVQIRFSESMEEEFHGMGIRSIENDEDLWGLDTIAPGTWDEPATAAMQERIEGLAWDNDPLDAEDHWKQSQETAKPILCKAHGTICKKGICAEYASQLRLAKRAEQAEQRKAAAANRGKKGGRGKGRGTAKKAEDKEPADKAKMQNNQFRGPGAPVKTNWRGAPRAIVSADTIEKREMTKAASDDGRGNSDSEVGPNPADVAPASAADTASDASWGVSEGAYDPWAQRKPHGKKKPTQTKTSSNWADQVESELAAGGGGGSFSVATSKHGKRGTSTTNRGTSAAKSSTSG